MNSGDSFREGVEAISSQQAGEPDGSIEERIKATKLHFLHAHHIVYKLCVTYPESSHLVPPQLSLSLSLSMAEAAQARIATLQAELGHLDGVDSTPQLGGQ